MREHQTLFGKHCTIHGRKLVSYKLSCELARVLDDTIETVNYTKTMTVDAGFCKSLSEKIDSEHEGIILLVSPIACMWQHDHQITVLYLPSATLRTITLPRILEVRTHRNFPEMTLVRFWSSFMF